MSTRRIHRDIGQVVVVVSLALSASPARSADLSGDELIELILATRERYFPMQLRYTVTSLREHGEAGLIVAGRDTSLLKSDGTTLFIDSTREVADESDPRRIDLDPGPRKQLLATPQWTKELLTDRGLQQGRIMPPGRGVDMASPLNLVWYLGSGSDPQEWKHLQDRFTVEVQREEDGNTYRLLLSRRCPAPRKLIQCE